MEIIIKLISFCKWSRTKGRKLIIKILEIKNGTYNNCSRNLKIMWTVKNSIVINLKVGKFLIKLYLANTQKEIENWDIYIYILKKQVSG